MYTQDSKTYSYEEAKQLCLKYFRGDEIATDAYLNKYALKKDGDKNLIYEPTPDYMHRRLAKEFARIEKKYPNGLSEMDIYSLLEHFKYIVPQGGSMAGIGNPMPVSLSNCFVIGTKEDSYGAICQTDEEQVQISKRRGGVGHDLSYLRPAGTIVHNAAGTSSGMVSFMERYSHSIREVCQEGRRGALMLSCSITHPQVEDFIDAKLDTGKVTGANISVKLTDKFMNAVKEHKSFEQKFPIDSDNPSVSRKIDATAIWKKIMYNAWKSAEPGVLFWDTILKESTARLYGDKYEEFSTNPCFIGDTIIAVADGRNGVTIKQLAEENKEFLVYSARQSKSDRHKKNGKWITEIKKATAFKTGTKKVIEIYLSDGSSFKCTEDHMLALSNRGYIKAKDSLNQELCKFFTFSNKATHKSYRLINSLVHYLQYHMMWHFLHGKYDTSKYNLHHIDDDSTNDLLSNLELINVEEHKRITLRHGKNNPIFRVNPEYNKLIQRRRNINANAKKWKWNEERRIAALKEFDAQYGEIMKEYKNAKYKKNVYLNEPIKVIDIKDAGIEDVYDLTVEDNHNFYIITKTDDEKFLNSSGILVHNCGEIPLCQYGACVLNCINLYSYVRNPFTSEAFFDLELFKQHVKCAIHLTDDIIDLEQEKVQQIIDKIMSDPEKETTKFTELNLWKKIYDMHTDMRRVGLGITGLGDMLAALNYTYGTKEATEFAASIQQTLAVAAYSTSIELAKERGAFKIWNYEIEKDAPFVNRVLTSMNSQTKREYARYGRRNVHCLTIAPTGTVSLMTQTTSGIECVFMPFYVRRRKVEASEPYDFVDKVGDHFQEYVVVHPKLVEWYIATQEPGMEYESAIEKLSKFSSVEMQALVDKSPYYHATTRDVDWVEKVRMQGEMQKFVDHSISVTVNLPESATEELVSTVYMTAWESGCKGCTIYREGSRDAVLINKEDKKSKKTNLLSSGHMSKRKPVLPAIVDVIKSRGETFAVLIGIDEGRPYEVFAFKIQPDEVPVFKTNKQTTITKVAKKHYSLGHEFDHVWGAENILCREGSEEEQAITRMVSTMLRGGRIPLEEIIDQIIKSSTSIEKFSKALAICLQKFLKDGLVLHEKCPNCGGDMISYEGCKKCVNCGQSKCG